MELFESKKKEASELPERVKMMLQQGFTKEQIVETLQREGNSSNLIFDAFSKAGMNPPVSQPTVVSAPENREMSDVEKVSTEEYIDSVIEEKWDELEEGVKRIIEWKNNTEKRVARIEQKIEDLKEEFQKLHNSVIGKIGEYDKSVQAIGTDIKALESAFKTILPEFTKNVSELSRITEKIKKQ